MSSQQELVAQHVKEDRAGRPLHTGKTPAFNYVYLYTGKKLCKKRQRKEGGHWDPFR